METALPQKFHTRKLGKITIFYAAIGYDTGRKKINVVNTFMRNVEKWPNILLKSCGVSPPDF